MTTHDEALQSIARHFAGRISPPREAAMRAHLPTCPSCRARYQRHLAYARLDRRVPRAEARIARGLGLRPAPSPQSSRARWVLALAGAAALIALFVWLPGRDGGGGPLGFTSRGGSAPAPSLWVYRVGAGGAPPELVGERIAPGDELAFAYANPAAKKYLALFAVDEHRHVYWYYPAWPVDAPPPEAVAARPGPGPHELPEAVRHELDGRHLDVYALFSDQPLGVAGIERAVGAPPSGLPGGTLVVRHSLEVLP